MAERQRPHILAFPFPAEGHINPLMNFTKRLVSKGIKITLIIATPSRKPAESHDSGQFNIEYISDGSNEGEEPNSMAASFRRLNAVMCRDLVQLIGKLKSSNNRPKILVYDSLLTWALDTAQKLGLLAASFFTQSCAVCTVYYYMYQGTLPINSPPEKSSVSIPLLPFLEVQDLPSFNLIMDPDLTAVKLLIDQFSNVEKANWILFNSFDKLESEVANWMASKWSIKTIGPTILRENKHHGTCLLETNSEACLKWLDKRDFRSVVYVSLGSVTVMKEEQMEELAKGIAGSGCYFLWTVKPSEESKLPVNFKSEISEKGLIVNWCPQPQVLAHQAVASLMTHCGWNSTLEALISGVPIIAFPQIVDQMTNTKFVTDIWQAGVRVKADDKGIVTREEVEMLIREVNQGERGKELRKNAEKWKDLAQEAIAPGGSSHKNIDEFVSQLLSI